MGEKKIAGSIVQQQLHAARMIDCFRGHPYVYVYNIM